MTGPVILEHPDAVRDGFNIYQFPLPRNQRNWERWYDGNYIGLFPPPTMGNGLAQLDSLHGVQNLPLFRVASNFLADAALADMPNITGHTEEQLAQWEEYEPLMERVLQHATRYWSIFGGAVIACEPGMARAINPMHYYRVGLPELRDQDAGHILLLPYTDQSVAQQQTQQDHASPNRIEVIKVLPDQAPTTQKFVFNGELIGGPLGPPAPSTIQAVYTAGEFDSWYGGARDAAAQLMIALAMAIVDLNHYSNREVYLPVSAADAIATAIAGPGENVGTAAGRQAVRRTLEETLRPLIAIDRDTNVPGDSREPVNLEDRWRLVETLADLFYIISRLTPSTYGIGIGRGESGTAREQGMQASAIAIRRYREQMGGRLPLILEMITGIARARVKFAWPRPPFQSREARAEEIRLDWEADLLMLDEARPELGYGTVGGDKGKMFKSELAAAAMPQPVDNSIANNDNGQGGGLMQRLRRSNGNGNQEQGG